MPMTCHRASLASITTHVLEGTIWRLESSKQPLRHGQYLRTWDGQATENLATVQQCRQEEQWYCVPWKLISTPLLFEKIIYGSNMLRKRSLMAQSACLRRSSILSVDKVCKVWTLTCLSLISVVLAWGQCWCNTEVVHLQCAVFLWYVWVLLIHFPSSRLHMIVV